MVTEDRSKTVIENDDKSDGMKETERICRKIATNRQLLTKKVRKIRKQAMVLHQYHKENPYKYMEDIMRMVGQRELSELLFLLWFLVSSNLF